MYYPSSYQLINETARSICVRLAERYGKDYVSKDVIHGFASFLQIVIEIQARMPRTTCEKEDKVADTPH